MTLREAPIDPSNARPRDNDSRVITFRVCMNLFHDSQEMRSSTARFLDRSVGVTRRELYKRLETWTHRPGCNLFPRLDSMRKHPVIEYNKDGLEYRGLWLIAPTQEVAHCKMAFSD